MTDHTHKFLLRWKPDGYPAEFDKLRVHWAACGCGETQPLRDFVRNLRRKAAEAEAEFGGMRAAIKLAYQCLKRHDYDEAENALLGTVPDEPAAVVNQKLTTQERKG